MNLRDYLAREGRGAIKRLSKRSGVPTQTIYRSSAGLNEPSVSTAVLISKGTDDEVPVDAVFCPRDSAEPSEPIEATS
jgi:hypothetical protein